MFEPIDPDVVLFGVLAADVSERRRAARHALDVLEYALWTPAPRRHRTWLHRLSVAVDALHTTLREQLPTADHPLQLLDEIALSKPEYLDRVVSLRQELLDLTIAVASLREQIEPDPILEIDPKAVTGRLDVIARQFGELQAREADLVHEALGIELDEQI